MSSREPERPEYERRVAGWLRQHFLENERHLCYHGGRITFEDVRLESPGSENSSVAVTFQASGRPGCLFGRRVDAVGPAEPWEDPDGAPEGWAQMVWIHLEEDIHTLPGLLKKGDPGTVVWV